MISVKSPKTPVKMPDRQVMPGLVNSGCDVVIPPIIFTGGTGIVARNIPLTKSLKIPKEVKIMRIIFIDEPT